MTVLMRWSALLAALLLAACASVPKQEVPPAPGFELSGRLAARDAGRSFSSALRWKQEAGVDEIWLTAPLGQTLAYLRADATGAVVTTADQKQYRAASLESLTRSALGWRFPVAGLRYWALGLTAPGVGVEQLERDQQNRLVRFRQDNLLVTFVYADAITQRPLRVDVSSGEAELRLVIDGLNLR